MIAANSSSRPRNLRLPTADNAVEPCVFVWTTSLWTVSLFMLEQVSVTSALLNNLKMSLQSTELFIEK